MLHIDIQPHTLVFRRPATTSRGTYHTHRSYIVRVADTAGVYCGECSPLPDLSADALPEADYLALLRHFCRHYAATGRVPHVAMLRYPSMRFGLETADALRQAGHATVFRPTPFTRGEESIPINGLVWMGPLDDMLRQMEEKVQAGFCCVKLKIGALDFDSEMEMVRRLRARFSAQDIELRVDANGAFAPHDAMARLETLAHYHIHSIEQPIRAGQWQEMARLCRNTPLPIALDEELIGLDTTEEKRAMLGEVRPQYIVLKPSLHGGMAGSREWKALADEVGAGSWLTSALESNVALYAIAQLATELYGPHITFPQGLGTGAIYERNIAMPVEVRGGRLWTVR